MQNLFILCGYENMGFRSNPFKLIRNVLRLMFRYKQQLLLLTPFITWIILFNFANNIPTRLRSKPNFKTLPLLEKKLFGSSLLCNQFPDSEILTTIFALPYLAHFALPWAFCLYLRSRGNQTTLFLWHLGILNVQAVIVQVLLPTSPPWYFEKFGFKEPDYNLTGDPGRLTQVDQILGFPLFETIYSMNPVILGAFPSLHAAWPLLISIYAKNDVLPNIKYMYVAWVWFAAIYLKHHYLLDIIGGAIFAFETHIFGCLLFGDEKNVTSKHYDTKGKYVLVSPV